MTFQPFKIGGHLRIQIDLFEVWIWVSRKALQTRIQQLEMENEYLKS